MTESMPNLLDLESAPLRKSRSTSEFLKKYFMAGQKTHDSQSLVPPQRSPFDDFVDRHRKAFALLVPFVFVQLIYWMMAFKYNWLVYFPLHYHICVLMMCAAFIGGATAEGGGAIAFPVLTLVFKVSPQAARDFAVMIQSVGLNSSHMSIRMMKVIVEEHTLLFCAIGGAAGTVFSLEYLDGLLSPTVKKISFVSLFFSFAIALFIVNKEKKRVTFDMIQSFDVEKCLILLMTGVVGGLFSGIAGSGLEVFVFSIIALLFRISEKVVAPTTVSLAGINSAVAFFWRHAIQQKLDPLAWEYFLVCIPVVAVFAPLGSMMSSFFHRQTLAVLIYAIETIALVAAFAIILPPLPIIGMSVGIIAGALIFYTILSRLGSTRYAKKQEGICREGSRTWSRRGSVAAEKRNSCKSMELPQLKVAKASFA